MILRQKKVLNKFSLLISSYKKYINPLKDVNDAQNPVNKISFLDWLNLLAMTKPNKKEPIIHVKKLLFIKKRKKVAKKEAIIIKENLCLFIY